MLRRDSQGKRLPRKPALESRSGVALLGSVEEKVPLENNTAALCTILVVLHTSSLDFNKAM
jgi:hypothetical protein